MLTVVTDKFDDRFYNALMDHRRFLVETSRTFSESMDRTVVGLAGGAIILSVTFLTSLEETPKHPWLMVVAWTVLGLAMLLVAASLDTAQRALAKQIGIIDRAITDPEGYDIAESGDPPVTRWLMIVAYACLLAGLAAMALFVSINFLSPIEAA